MLNTKNKQCIIYNSSINHVKTFPLASWTLISQLLYLPFGTIYLISHIIPTVCRRLFMVPRPTRPSRPSCDVPDISPSPSLSPRRKDQAQQQQQTQRNSHSDPNLRRVAARLPRGCRGKGRCVRARGCIVDRRRIQRRGREGFSEDVGKRRIAAAGISFFRAAEEAVVVPLRTTRDCGGVPVDIHLSIKISISATRTDQYPLIPRLLLNSEVVRATHR